ncbi:hypothetical protein JOE68_003431 [Saccharothrix algeriensis]|uniref:DUF5667 domain-containing protein n=2 Tax=Saccharothrix algeriensis TaxID=173560 RepID=A0ABS2S8K1_9PSEU|nr:hypothetical protein [Saccharothrix algeriensis]
MVGRGITPLGRRRQRERFARAVDALPGDADPEFADELAVVALLREAAATSGPDEAARARMRERVLGASPPPGPAADRRPPRGGARGRLAVALVAALCLVLSLAGMSVLLSRDALPGDALYGVKRTAESASLGLTFDEESKGYKRLEFAAARVAELETLVDRYRDSGGGPLGGYLTALADFDADAAAGSRALAARGSGADRLTLGALRDWATSQTTRLGDLHGRLPAAAAARADRSLDLLARVARRAADLAARPPCATAAPGRADEIGPLPAEGDCAAPPSAQPGTPATAPPVPPAATEPTGGAPATTTAPAQAPPTGGTTPGPPPPSSPPPPPPSSGATTPPVRLPTITLPSLPLPGLTG